MAARETVAGARKEAAPEPRQELAEDPRHEHGRDLRLVARVHANPGPLKPDQAGALHRTLGNRAVTRRVQAHMRVGPVRDRFEIEADRVADRIVRAAPIQRHPDHDHDDHDELHRHPAAVQRHAHAHGCGCSACATIQRHPGHDHDDDELQRHPAPTIQRHPGHHHDDDELHRHPAHDHDDELHRHPAPDVQRHAHDAGCCCGDCVGVQRKAAGDGGFAIDGPLASRVDRLSLGGSPLPEAVRADMESRFDADFSAVRIHADGEADALNRELRADAFTRGQHIAFAAGRYAPSTQHGRWLLAHELTHTLQQSGPGGWLQRHSTHEHYLLGTLKPQEIASLPTLRSQIEKTGKIDLHSDSPFELHDEEDDNVDIEQYGDAIHLLEQEMDRLVAYQDQDPEQQLASQDGLLGARVGVVERVERDDDGVHLDDEVAEVDPEYQVPIVRIPTKGGTSVICTYGELNTLADMFGNLQDLADTEPAAVLAMLQGVRQRVYLALHAIHAALASKSKKKKVRKYQPWNSFKGQIGFSGKEKGPLGALGAVQGYEKATLDEDGKFTASNATAALARNACHFAPETWYTWRRYHDKARELALKSYKAGQDGAFIRDNEYMGMTGTERSEYATQLLKDQRDLANQALLHSGFGDHYLQDAYASGHLIDKTRVMQWFFAWQKKRGSLRDTPTYKMIGTLVSQDLRSNPQMMENVQGGVDKKLEHIGVKVEDHILVLMWWRKQALGDKNKPLTPIGLKGSDAPVKLSTPEEATALLDRLVSEGYATVKQVRKIANYTLKDEAIAPIDTRVKDSKKSYSATLNPDSPDDWLQQAQEFYYVAYAKFLDQSHLQLITNYLHNIFCESGLEVATESGEKIGKIYGDANMLNEGSESGLLHSSTTGQMARDAILSILESGAARHSADTIDRRFPRQVKVPSGWHEDHGGGPVPIKDWWAALEKECTKDDGMFKKGIDWSAKFTGAKRIKDKLTPDELTITPFDELSEPVPIEPTPFEELLGIEPPKHDPLF